MMTKHYLFEINDFGRNGEVKELFDSASFWINRLGYDITYESDGRRYYKVTLTKKDATGQGKEPNMSELFGDLFNVTRLGNQKT